MHEPALLFLDEPTIGLDVVAKERIRRFIQHANLTKGTTVILTTHDLTDIEKLCERVIILDQCQVLFDGALDALVTRFETSRIITVTFAEQPGDFAIPGVDPPERIHPLQARYTFDGNHISTSDVVQQLFSRFQVADLDVTRPPIENTIRRIYEERLLLTNGTVN